MDNFANTIKHYTNKAHEHLSRVRLSHVMGLATLQSQWNCSEPSCEKLLHESFPDSADNQFNMDKKLRKVLNEVHLISLKANFELLLNRLLKTIWDFYPDTLDASTHDKHVRRRSPSLARATPTEAHKAVADRMMRHFGLSEFDRQFHRVLDCNFAGILGREDSRYWPQILTSFEVRHLLEHSGATVDKLFREHVGDVWRKSTWGNDQILDDVKKIAITEEDIAQTYRAMDRSADLIRDELLRWGERRTG